MSTKIQAPGILIQEYETRQDAVSMECTFRRFFGSPPGSAKFKISQKTYKEYTSFSLELHWLERDKAAEKYAAKIENFVIMKRNENEN